MHLLKTALLSVRKWISRKFGREWVSACLRSPDTQRILYVHPSQLAFRIHKSDFTISLQSAVLMKIICENFTTFIALNVFTDTWYVVFAWGSNTHSMLVDGTIFVIFRNDQSKCIPRIFHWWGEGGWFNAEYIYICIYNLYLILKIVL